MVLLKHYDLTSGTVEVVDEYATRDEAQEQYKAVCSLDKGTDSVWYLDEGE